jgi:hypothetical protein
MYSYQIYYYAGIEEILNIDNDSHSCMSFNPVEKAECEHGTT